MVEIVSSVAMPADERLEIKKMRYVNPNITEEKEIEALPRISVVTGTHGDELEGQSVCYELGKIIKEHMECLHGVVDIYPALNPLGIDSITRGIPGFDIDMNRIFPGSMDGSMAEHVAADIVKDIKGSALCVDIHASNIFLKEIPQIRISEMTSEKLVPLAKKMNIDYIWVHSAATVLESTLAHSLNSVGTPTLVVEMGVGMRLTEEYTHQLVDGLLYIMRDMGIWSGKVIDKPKKPIVSQDGKVSFFNAKAAGVFMPKVKHCDMVKAGDVLGSIVNPLTAEVVDEMKSPCDGLIFTLREYPVVDEGSLIARILEM
ncbi:MAG: succinylglutamate desuccinylase/aspartoacylase family protein [Lachnospiraceae bacterium]|nr:succinylglutamate desuccinylase/aspartoacylase family protein [Lachnospiraceae bacterium]